VFKDPADDTLYPWDRQPLLHNNLPT
jgi:hypothetical protein